MKDAPKILLVDDDMAVLQALKGLLKAHYQVIATQDCFEALKILRREKIHVIIADERMPIISGTEILRHARYISPFATRILLADSDCTMIDVSDKNEIFSCIQQPWNYANLYETMIRAVEQSKYTEATRTISSVKKNPLLNNDQLAHPVTDTFESERLICLVLDQDGCIYQMVKSILEPSVDVVWRQSATEALSVLNCYSVAILVTELNLGDQEIRSLFNTVKHCHAEMLTLVLTDLCDVSLLSELTVRRQIFRSLPKPARRGILEKNLKSAITCYQTSHPSAQVIATTSAKRLDIQLEVSDRVVSSSQMLLARVGVGRAVDYRHHLSHKGINP